MLNSCILLQTAHNWAIPSDDTSLQKNGWQYNQLWLLSQHQNEVLRSIIIIIIIVVVVVVVVGRDSAIGIATCYGLDGPGI